MRRRRFLCSAGVSTIGIIGLAGCGAPGPGAQDTPAGDAGDTPVEETTPTETMAGSPTESPTSEGTPTEAAPATPTSASTSQGKGDGTSEIFMVTAGSDYYFDPIGLFVEQGETVTWTIESDSHSSTAYAQGNGAAEVTRIPEGAGEWNSGIMTEQGATFEQTFDVPGTYDYFCTPHKQLGMVGRLVVGEPGGPAEGNQPPDGAVPESDAIVEDGAIGWEEFTG